MDKRYPTVASVSLVAALKLFKKIVSCSGQLTCSECGELGDFRHQLVGEAASIAESLQNLFRLTEDIKRGSELRDTLKEIYRKHRSTFVHDAILRHGEFAGGSNEFITEAFCAGEWPPVRLKTRNELSTLALNVRRALLSYLHAEGNTNFDSSAFGLEQNLFKASLGSIARYEVNDKVWLGIRAMGRMNDPDW